MLTKVTWKWIFALSLISICNLLSAEEDIKTLDLDVIAYEDFLLDSPQALEQLKTALHEKGIVGIKGIPTFKEKVGNFIAHARKFTYLPESIKSSYAPNRDLGEMFLGYEAGKERFKRPDGRWVVDDLKVSYYGLVPDCSANKWPVEVDLRTPFQHMGELMAKMGEAVMKKISLVEAETGISVKKTPKVGRMLYYKKSLDTASENPYWCGAHFDHGLFTALLPAFYFKNGQPVEEPREAGLYIRTPFDQEFKKVVVDSQDIMLFQVGEFGQLATNDGIKATEHRVQKAPGNVERFTMALFFDAPADTVIFSTSMLTADERYGGVARAPCSYAEWNEASFKRYLVREEE